MNIFKILGIFLLHTIVLSTQSFSMTADKLTENIAKLMNVKTEDIKIKKQKLGMTSSQNYVVEINGQQYILKIFKKRMRPEPRENEIKLVKTFSELGLGPKFITASNDNSFYIRGFVDGRLEKPTDFKNEQALINLAKALKKLHSHKSDIKSLKTLENRLKKHYRSVLKKKVALPSGFEKAYMKYKALYEKLPKLDGFCHNDLNPLNILILENGEISFIDLENAGNANVYEELGYVTLLCGISGENLKVLLRNYFEREPSQEELDAVKLAQRLVSFLTAIIWFDFSESKKDKEIPIEKRQKALDNLLNSKDLKTAQDFINEGKIVSVKSKDKLLVRQYALAFYKYYLDS